MRRKLLCIFLMALLLSGCSAPEPSSESSSESTSESSSESTTTVPTTSESTFNYNELQQPSPIPDDLTKKVTYDEDGNPSSAMIYEDGNLIREYHYDPGDAAEESQTLYYYDAGLLIMEKEVCKGSLQGYTEYKYDDSGRLIGKDIVDENSYLDQYIYNYDESGACEMTWIGHFGNKRIYKDNEFGDRISYEEFDEFGKAVKKETCEYEYDDRGNALRKTTYQDGHITDETLAEYDKFNNVIKRSEYHDGKLLREMIVEYSPDYSQATFDFIGYYGGEAKSTSYFLKKYDSNGNLLEDHWYDGGKDSDMIQITYYTYDDAGNLLCKEFGNQKNIYEYDDKGNMISSAIYIDGEVRSADTYEYIEQ